jgi:hypothetical protein
MATGVNDDLTVPTGTALVPLSAAGEAAATTGVRPRPSATFLAHLVATAQGAPQTRQRRRANPDHAATLYAAAAAKKERPSALVASM